MNERTGSFESVLLCVLFRPADEEAEAEEGEGGVEEEKFVAELVAAEPAFGVELEDEADGRGEERDEGHVLVFHLLFREDAEGEEAQDGAIGVARELVDGVDGAGAVQGVENDGL